MARVRNRGGSTGLHQEGGDCLLRFGLALGFDLARVAGWALELVGMSALPPQ
jgi:hypothetical protein